MTDAPVEIEFYSLSSWLTRAVSTMVRLIAKRLLQSYAAKPPW